MADSNPEIPRFEPYISMPVEDILRLNDIERLIYDNPEFFKSAIDGLAEGPEADEVRGHVNFILKDVGEPIPFDDATEDDMADNWVMRDILNRRRDTKDADERAKLTGELLNLRLRLFVGRVAALHERDDSHKIRQFPGSPSVSEAGAKTGGNGDSIPA